MKKRLIKILQIPPYRLYETFRDKKLFKKRFTKQQSLIQAYFDNNTQKKLHIGCGANILEGWLNTDFNDKDDKIAFLDAGNEFPLPNASFDYVFSEHLFEHLDVDQQINMVEECLRILKPSGIMRIATPSLEFLNDLYNYPKKEINQEYIDWAVKTSSYLMPVRKKLNDESEFYCYVINNFYKAWGHKMIHNFDSLHALVSQIGFIECNQVKIGESLFEPLQNIEKHGTVIPVKFNDLETMVIEFKK